MPHVHVEIEEATRTVSRIVDRFCGAYATHYVSYFAFGHRFYDHFCDACLSYTRSAERLPSRLRAASVNHQPSEESNEMTAKGKATPKVAAVATITASTKPHVASMPRETPVDTMDRVRGSILGDPFRTVLVKAFIAGPRTKDDLKEVIFAAFKGKSKGYLALRLGKCLNSELASVGAPVAFVGGKYGMTLAADIVRTNGKPTNGKPTTKHVEKVATKGTRVSTSPDGKPLPQAGTFTPAPKPTAKAKTAKKGARK